MSHIADEPIPPVVISSMLNNNWNEYSGHIPKPTFIVPNDGVTPLRENLTTADYVYVTLDTPGYEEIPIGNWSYVNRRYKVLLQLRTRNGRQRLYNLFREIRRVTHSQIHSLADYQRVRFESFNELFNEDFNIWDARIIISLENAAVAFETTG